MDWLNEVTGDDINFFGIEIELWRIGESAIAPKFNMVSKPNEWTKGKGGTSAVVSSEKELSPTRKLQLEFWQLFREYMEDNSSIMRPQKPNPCHWMNFSIGTSKAFPAALLNMQSGLISISLQINKGEDRFAIFNLLKQDKVAIEEEMGAALDWEEKPENKCSYVFLRNPQLDPKKKNDWPMQHQWLLENLETFHAVFSSRIRDMDTGDWQPDDDGE